MKLSVLDQSTSAQSASPHVAIQETLALARHCDELGYHRYWVSEHHASDSIVGTAPEVLCAAIAATTTRLRVGSAGVMLPHYSALHVAEQFRVLEAIAPGRIDLGVGRAPGSDRLTAYALNPYENAAEEFPRQVLDLRAWVCGEPLDEGHPFAAIKAHPQGPTCPEIWVLGSSDYGAQLAAHLGLPYAFAWFFADGQGADLALSLYRELYRPSPRHPAPQATLCVWALVADSDDEARHQALSRERWRVDRQRGVFGALHAPADVAARGFTPDEAAVVRAMRSKAFVGSAATVGAQLRQLAAQFELDEIVVNTWATEPAVRRRSYELLAEEFGLRNGS